MAYSAYLHAVFSFNLEWKVRDVFHGPLDIFKTQFRYMHLKKFDKDYISKI